MVDPSEGGEPVVVTHPPRSQQAIIRYNLSLVFDHRYPECDFAFENLGIM
jgi:hypothetical protein